MSEIREKKARIREKFKQIRKSVIGEEKARLDNDICKNFLSSATYMYNDTFLMYSPVRDEIDINLIARTALKDGKRLAYPRCVQGTNKMDFYYVTSLDELSKGSFGILEPPENPNNKFDRTSSSSAVCLLPAVVYDKRGYRLGYGKGYYDRYLSTYKGSVIGIIYKRLITDNVPHGRFDITADALITEEGVISIAKN